MTHFGPIRELVSQDKQNPHHLKSWVHPETWARSPYLEQKPLEPFIDNCDELLKAE